MGTPDLSPAEMYEALPEDGKEGVIMTVRVLTTVTVQQMEVAREPGKAEEIVDRFIDVFRAGNGFEPNREKLVASMKESATNPTGHWNDATDKTRHTFLCEIARQRSKHLGLDEQGEEELLEQMDDQLGNEDERTKALFDRLFEEALEASDQ